MIEKGVYSVLSSDSDITGLVSTRIYPIMAPQDATIPYLVYRRAFTDHVQTKTRTNDTLLRATVSVTGVAATYLAAKSLIDTVRQTLHGYAGTAGGVVIQGIISDGEYDSSEIPSDASDVPRYQVTYDFGVWATETAPS